MKNSNLEEYTVDSFLNALNLLFFSKDKELQDKANKFLLKFETKPESWKIAHDVLIMNNLSEQVYYNALNILKNKIIYEFGAKNRESIDELLSFFESNLDRFKNNKQYIVKNFCECIGKAFIFTGNKFKDTLQKFITRLDKDNDIYSQICLLLIFNYICEASTDDRIVLEEEEKNAFKKNIIDISGYVFIYIKNMIGKTNYIGDISLKKCINNYILDTLNNYLYIDLNEDTINKFNNDYLPIINFIFQIDEENLAAYGDCIANLLYLPLHEPKMQTLANLIFGKINELKDVLYKRIKSLDEDQTYFYINVFTSLIENNIDTIFKEKRFDFFKIIIDLVKKCSSQQIESIYDFFSKLNKYLENNKYTFEDIMNIFKNYFIQLFLNIFDLIVFDEDIFVKLNKQKTSSLHDDEQYNDIKDFRYSAKDIMKDFLEYYGFEFIFNEIVFPQFEKTTSEIQKNPNSIHLWSKLESLVYIFSCMTSFINEESPSFKKVQMIFYTILETPKECIHIKRTFSDLIDECCTIFQTDKNLLFKIFKYLVEGLDNKLTLKYCSVSANRLLKENKEIMSELKKDMLEFYDKKLKNQVIENSNYLEILEGVIEVIVFTNEKNNNYEIIKNTIVIIMKDWFNNLKNAKNLFEKNNSMSPEQKQDLIKVIKILKSITRAIFGGLYQENKNIMIEIFQEIWPNINFIMNKMPTDGIIIEENVQLIKIFMRGLGKDFIKFIPDYICIIINGFKLSPISSYLYGFEILAIAFPNPKEQELKNLLINTFKELCRITLTSYIKKEDINLFVEVGEDFFGMLYRIIKQTPGIIVESGVLNDLIYASINLLDTSEIEISKHIIYFLIYIIKFESLDSIKKLLTQDQILAQKYKNVVFESIKIYSKDLCQKILYLYINNSVTQIIENITELFIDFIIYYKEYVLKYMEMHMTNLPNDILTNKEKKDFLNCIDEYTIKQEEFKSFMTKFKKRCKNRQYRNRESYIYN